MKSILILTIMLILLYIRKMLKDYRIKKGYYGNNEYEIREILNDYYLKKKKY